MAAGRWTARGSLHGYSIRMEQRPSSGNPNPDRISSSDRSVTGLRAHDHAVRGKAILERANGFEPSTLTLARLCSTPELRPRPKPATYGKWNRAFQGRRGASVARYSVMASSA